MTIEQWRIDQSIENLANRLDSRAKLVRLAAAANNKMVIDWEVILEDINEGFDTVMEMIGISDPEDEVLDEIESEEELDTEPHPLDEDDEWHEGFDDA